MRFLPALAAVLGKEGRLRCSPAATRRPIAPLITALNQLGAQIESTDGAFPLLFPRRTNALKVHRGEINVDAEKSSQFISALMLASALLPSPLQIAAPHGSPSAPYLRLTEEMMKDFGVPCHQTAPKRWICGGVRPEIASYEVPADLANAAPYLAALILLGGQLLITNWPKKGSVYAAFWEDLLRRYQGTIVYRTHACPSETANTAALIRCSSALARRDRPLPRLDIDMRDYGELVPALAALAALTGSGATLRNIGHLRGHETDRLQALCHEIRAAGGHATADANTLVIGSAATKPTAFHSYGDHRMATFGAIMGLGLPGSTVDDITVTSKTMTDFADTWISFLSSTKQQESDL